jgi:hypothetical protein
MQYVLRQKQLQNISACSVKLACIDLCIRIFNMKVKYCTFCCVHTIFHFFLEKYNLSWKQFYTNQM